jgi:hypothetical protein
MSENKTVTTKTLSATTKVLEPVVMDNLPDVPKGSVLLVGLKADGTEKPNSWVIVGEATYERVYKNNPKFKLKKKSDRE